MSSALRWEMRMVPGADPTAWMWTCTWLKLFSRMFSWDKLVMVGFASTAWTRPEGSDLHGRHSGKRTDIGADIDIGSSTIEQASHGCSSSARASGSIQ